MPRSSMTSSLLIVVPVLLSSLFFGKKQVFVVFDSFHESAIVFDIHENVGRLVSFDQNDWIVVGPLQQCGSATIAELADWSKVIEYVKCACHDKPFLKPNFIPNYIPVLIPRFMVVRLLNLGIKSDFAMERAPSCCLVPLGKQR